MKFWSWFQVNLNFGVVAVIFFKINAQTTLSTIFFSQI